MACWCSTKPRCPMGKTQWTGLPTRAHTHGLSRARFPPSMAASGSKCVCSSKRHGSRITFYDPASWDTSVTSATLHSSLHHTLLDESATSPPRSQGKGHRPYLSMRRMSKHFVIIKKKNYCKKSVPYQHGESLKSSQKRWYLGYILEEAEVCQKNWNGWEVVLQREQRTSGIQK